VHDCVGPQLRPDLGESLVRILGAVNEFGPDGCGHRLELIDGRPAELRRGLADELGPAAADGLVTFGRRRQPHQPFFETACSELALERVLDHEYGADTPLPQMITESDEVVGRPPRAGFGKQCDGRLRHGRNLRPQGTLVLRE
jgi:hypothetical protein